jgi:hypothetical protein
MQMLKENEVKFVDLRFADTRGKEQHVTVPISHFDDDKFESGHAFDGSSIAGWKGIEASDMLLIPDPSTANLDPFMEETTVFMQCDVIEPSDGKGYDRDPRSIAKRAEAYLKSSGIGDTAFFGPEPEFFIFDSVKWRVDMSGSMVKINSEEAAWSSDQDFEGGNSGHRPGVKGGYFPVPPVDSFQDMRSEMCLILESLGIPVEVHHHEVAGAGQNEIGTRFSTLVERADWTQTMKYVIWNVAHSYGKTATFMPKPMNGDNGSGMHVHQSIWKEGKNLFAGDGYAGLSETALYYIGGIINHESGHQLVQAPGAWLRSPGQAGLLGPQPFGLDPHPARGEPERPPHRDPLPGPAGQRLPVLRLAADGGPGRHPEQDPPGRSRNQGPVPPAAGRGQADPDRLLLAGRSPGRPEQGPRVPDPWRRVQRQHDRRLHRPEDAGSAAHAHDPASGRIRHVLLVVSVAPK